MVKISVVVCTKNRADMLKDCVDSLLNQDIKESYEILIIDNDSNDDTEEVANRLIAGNENIRYFKEKVIGYSAPRNRGWKEAKGEYVAYIDDDEIAPVHWLHTIFESFQNEFRPDIVGGNYLLKYDVEPPNWFKENMEKVYYGDKKGFLDVRKYPYGFAGGNVAFRKEVLEKLDGFSDMFNMKDDVLLMGEDSKICKKAIEEGLKLYYDPDIYIYHRMSEKNYDVSRRTFASKRKGMGIRLISGRKNFFSHYYRYLTLFIMKLFLPLLCILRVKYYEVKIKEKIAFREGYFKTKNM